MYVLSKSFKKSYCPFSFRCLSQAPTFLFYYAEDCGSYCNDSLEP